MKHILLTVILILIAATSAAAQLDGLKAAYVLSETEIQALAAEYGETSTSSLRERFKTVTADTDTKTAFDRLPDSYRKLQIAPTSAGELNRVFGTAAKAQKLTGIIYKYETVLLNSPTLFAASDSNALLLISAGMVGATNENGLLGVILHEIAHSLFVRRTLDAKLKFNSAAKKNDFAAMNAARAELVKIEFECDLIAVKFLDKHAADYIAALRVLAAATEAETRAVNWHPQDKQREDFLKEFVKARETYAKK